MRYEEFGALELLNCSALHFVTARLLLGRTMTHRKAASGVASEAAIHFVELAAPIGTLPC